MLSVKKVITISNAAKFTEFKWEQLNSFYGNQIYPSSFIEYNLDLETEY